MSKYRNAMIVLLCLVIASGLLAVVNPFSKLSEGEEKTNGPEVKVANTADEPVPTSIVGGTVSVSNFPDVQQVNGTVSVENLQEVQTVVGSVDVQGQVSVSNFPDTNEQRVKIYLKDSTDARDEGRRFFATNSMRVPEGKLLLVDYVSAEVRNIGSSESVPNSDASVVIAGGPIQIYRLGTTEKLASDNWTYIGKAIPVYAAAGEIIEVDIRFRDPVALNLYISVYITGRLIDEPDNREIDCTRNPLDPDCF